MSKPISRFRLAEEYKGSEKPKRTRKPAVILSKGETHRMCKEFLLTTVPANFPEWELSPNGKYIRNGVFKVEFHERALKYIIIKGQDRLFCTIDRKSEETVQKFQARFTERFLKRTSLINNVKEINLR